MTTRRSLRPTPPTPAGVGGVERPSWKYESSPKAQLKVREGLGGPPGGLGVVRRPTRRSGRGQETHPKVWEGSECPPGSKRGREAHPEVSVESAGPPKGSKGDGRSTRRSGRC